MSPQRSSNRAIRDCWSKTAPIFPLDHWNWSDTLRWIEDKKLDYGKYTRKGTGKMLWKSLVMKNPIPMISRTMWTGSLYLYLCSISPIPHSQTNTYPAVVIIIELRNFNTQTDRQTYVDDWRAHTHTNKLGLIWRIESTIAAHHWIVSWFGTLGIIPTSAHRGIFQVWPHIIDLMFMLGNWCLPPGAIRWLP